jgi:acetyl esterase
MTIMLEYVSSCRRVLHQLRAYSQSRTNPWNFHADIFCKKQYNTFMALNLLNFPRFLALFLRLKLLNLTSKFPPLPGGVPDEQTSLMRAGQLLMSDGFIDALTPAQARYYMRNGLKMLRSFGALFEKVEAIRHISIPADSRLIPAQLYLPGAGKDYPLLVYFHGGGFVTGDLVTADNTCRFLCRRAGVAVLSVDYRLAPEYAFPAAVEDCLAATCWAAEHAGSLSADPERLLVGGDSAGGTLAAAVAQLCRDLGTPKLVGQALLYPATNVSSLDTPSYGQFGGRDYALPKRDVEWYRQQYTPRPADRLDPRASPLLAEDLRGLPPALVVTAEFDVLRDEGEAYARLLNEAGVPVRLMRCNGMQHGFASLIGFLRRSTLYMDEIAREIRRMVEREAEKEAEPALAG